MIAASGRSLGRGAGSERLTTAMTIVSTVRPAASGTTENDVPRSIKLIDHAHTSRLPITDHHSGHGRHHDEHGVFQRFLTRLPLNTGTLERPTGPLYDLVG
jgi:hypothetical protein